MSLSGTVAVRNMKVQVYMSKEYSIVVLRGDGISKEVIPEAVKALNVAQASA